MHVIAHTSICAGLETITADGVDATLFINERLTDLTADPFVTTGEKIELAVLIRLLNWRRLSPEHAWRLTCIYHGVDPDSEMLMTETKRFIDDEFERVWRNVRTVLDGKPVEREREDAQRAKAAALHAMELIRIALDTDRNLTRRHTFVYQVAQRLGPEVLQAARRLK
jgi:hypothetical protein